MSGRPLGRAGTVVEDRAARVRSDPGVAQKPDPTRAELRGMGGVYLHGGVWFLGDAMQIWVPMMLEICDGLAGTKGPGRGRFAGPLVHLCGHDRVPPRVPETGAGQIVLRFARPGRGCACRVAP